MATLDSNEILYRAFEPQLKNRFILYMDGIPSFMIKKVKAPTFTDEQIKIPHINSYFKVRGGQRVWEDIDMTLYQPITPSGAQAVMEWARLGHETVTGRSGYSDFYKKDLVINIVGPPGDIVGEWVIKGAFLTKGDFGDFSWEDPSTTNDIQITVACDACILNF
jgi:hypothetical protein